MQVYGTTGYSAVYNSGVYTNSDSSASTALSDEELEQVQEILSQYDPENLSEEDAQAIREAFKEQGITPGFGLDQAVTDAGFSVDEIRGQGGMPPPPGGMPPPPPPSQNTSSGSDSLLDYLSSLDSEEQSETLTQMSGLSTEGYEALKEALDTFGTETAGMSEEEKSQSFSEMLSSIFEQYSANALDTSTLVESVAVDTYA